jgi:hypothetical protein
MTLGLFGFALAACHLDGSLLKDTCSTSHDCNAGNACLQSVCVATGDGSTPVDGGVPPATKCKFPPAECGSALGSPVTVTPSTLSTMLPGRWLWCSGSDYDGSPFNLGPSGTIGIEFNADATQWWFLSDAGNGQVMHESAFDAGGGVDYISGTNQLNLLTSSTSHFGLLISLTNGPPPQMQITSDGPSATYVFEGGNCGGAIAPGFSGSAPPTTYGSCDPNNVYPNSCPTAGGVECSACGPGAASQCTHPCHLSGNDCGTEQTCTAWPQFDYTLAGSCAGFDGYCQ